MFKANLSIVVLVLITVFAQTEAIFFNEFHESESVEFLLQFIPIGSLVFDVGANVGKKAELYIKCGAGHVVCFEPQIECIGRLKSLFGRRENLVSIEQCGLGAIEKQETLYICSQASTLSTCHQNSLMSGRFFDHQYTWDRRTTIDIKTLDMMIGKYGVPAYCKIDVEGFEYEVLKGLSQQIPCISFECNIENLSITIKCIDYLCQMGYRKFNFAPGERGWFLFSDWLSGEELKKQIMEESKKDIWRECWGMWGDIYVSI